jgi:hypothetical protein
MFQHWYLWSFWYYVAGALIALFATHIVVLAVMPIAFLLPIISTYLVYRSYMTFQSSHMSDHQVQPSSGQIC